jgi:YggT family protein
MGGLVASLLELYGLLILVYVVLSWFVVANRSTIVADLYRVLASVCEPYISLFRRLLPPISVGSAGLDLSPLVAWVVLQIVASFVRRLG